MILAARLGFEENLSKTITEVEKFATSNELSNVSDVLHCARVCRSFALQKPAFDKGFVSKFMR